MRLIAAKALISNAFVASESLFAIHFHQQLLFCVTIANHLVRFNCKIIFCNFAANYICNIVLNHG